MSPFEIKMLLAIYVSRSWEDEYRDLWHTDTWAHTVEKFKNDGLISEHRQATEKLNAYVKALCEMPLPVQVWVMPKERDNG